MLNEVKKREFSEAMIEEVGTIRFMSDTFLKSLTFFLVLFLDLQEMQ